MRVQDFIDRVWLIGGNSYLVGGAVRDEILGVEINDKDYCVAGITQEDFEQEFPSAELQGKDFPVYRLSVDGEICEVALARKERKKSEGYRGFEVISDSSVTIEEDLSRRDLTVNAMAVELTTWRLIDPFNGKEDIERKILRATTEAFKEDPLRVYRTARFAAKYGFTVDESTLKQMSALKSELKTLSTERVLEETKKGLLTDTPSKYFRVLKEADVMSEHYPEIDVLSGFDQPKSYHPEGDTFEHTMQVLDAARFFAKGMPVVEGESRKKRTERELILGISALLHDVGKAVTQGTNLKTGVITYREHESEGVPIASEYLARYNLVTWAVPVLYGVANHMLMHRAIWEMKAAKLVDVIEGKFVIKNTIDAHGREQKYSRKEGVRESMGVADFIVLCKADAVGRLSDKRNLQGVLELVNGMEYLYNAGRFKEASKLGEKVYTIVENAEEAKNLLQDIENVLRNAVMISLYSVKGVGIKATKDVQELAQRHSGEDLGYAIHEDKRKQRISIMNNVRKHVNGLMAGNKQKTGGGEIHGY